MGLIGVGVVFLEYLEIIKNKSYKSISEAFKCFEIKKIFFLIIPGPFAFMAFINIIIATIFNYLSQKIDFIKIGIDNPAHLGGLVAGILINTSLAIYV